MEMHGLNGEGPVLDEVFEEDETAATTGDDERDTAGPRFGELLLVIRHCSDVCVCK